jgi:hypothetical protein
MLYNNVAKSQGALFNETGTMNITNSTIATILPTSKTSVFCRGRRSTIEWRYDQGQQHIE